MILGLVGKTLEAKLQAAFSPDFLQVIDESSQHQGHAGARPDGESHFRVALELKERVHALAIEAAAPKD